MEKVALNYKGTFIKELRIASYVLAGLGFVAAIIILSSLETGYFRDSEANAMKWVTAISTLVGSVIFSILGLVISGIAESALVQRAKAEIELYKMGYQPEDDVFFMSAEAMNELTKEK